MRVKMNGITTSYFGALYPDNNGFLKCSYNYRESDKYEIEIEILLSAQNNGIQEIVRIANTFPWFDKKGPEICGLIITSFFSKRQKQLPVNVFQTTIIYKIFETNSSFHVK